MYIIKKHIGSTCRIVLILILSALLVSCVSKQEGITTQESNATPEQTYNLTIEAGAGGTIPGGQAEFINGKYKEGEEIRLIARSNPGYYFIYWTSSNGGIFADKSDSQTTFTMPVNDVVITANFALSEQN